MNDANFQIDGDACKLSLLLLYKFKEFWTPWNPARILNPGATSHQTTRRTMKCAESRARMNQTARARDVDGAIRVAVLDAPDMSGTCVSQSFRALMSPGLAPICLTPAELIPALDNLDVVFCPGGSHRQASHALPFSMLSTASNN